MEFYTYLWLRYDGTPYYVGKGKGNRAYTSEGHSVRRPKDSSRILLQAFLTEQDALEAEKILIAFFGRLDLGTGCLRNLTDGGDGVTHSPEQRRKKSDLFIALGIRPSYETAVKGGRAMKGRTHLVSDETREKLRRTMKGRGIKFPHWAALRGNKISTSRQLGVPRTQQVRARMSATKQSKIPNDEIIRLYESGLSSIAIGKKLGRACKTIRNRLHSLGVSVRPVGPYRKVLPCPISKSVS